MTDPPATKRARHDKEEDEQDIKLAAAEVRVVKIQFEKDTTFHRFDDLLDEYCRFMKIKIKGQPAVTHFAPSKLIDKFWHAHILSTKEYFAFCTRHNNGDYLHHDPTMTKVQERYELTLEAYENIFGERPTDKIIWPDHVDTQPSDDDDDEDDDDDGGDDDDDDGVQEDSDEFGCG